ncbi:MAG: enoyl-CoA hydratase/isomerase family protein [Burkholderiaceae bacterium]
MSYNHLRLTLREGCAELELDRPDKLNALLPETLLEISRAIDEVSVRSDIKCLVLSGRGEHFCAGMDVGARLEGKDTKRDWVEKRNSIVALNKLNEAPLVTICRMQGYVVGAGLLLAAACRLRYATPDTTFYIPELDLGIPFSLGGVAVLSRTLGVTRVAEMVLTCSKIKADSELVNGFVTRVLAPDQIGAHVEGVVRSLVARPNSLLLPTLSTLREAERALLPDAASDLFTMMYVNVEPEASEVRTRYSKKFKRG